MAEHHTYLELSEDNDTAHKFYEVVRSGTQVTITFGAAHRTATWPIRAMSACVVVMKRPSNASSPESGSVEHGPGLVVEKPDAFTEGRPAQHRREIGSAMPHR